MAEYSTLKVPELKKLLADKKLPQTGNKADLIARLQDDDVKNAKSPGAAAPSKHPFPGQAFRALVSLRRAAFACLCSAQLIPSPPALAQLDKEDEIDYTDDEDITPLPATTPATAPKPVEVKQSEPQDKKQQVPAAVPAAQESVAQGEEPKDETAPVESAQSFAMGLSKTAADAEAKKRADRAKRFGIDEDEDAKRRAERAKRFGIDENELASGLDSALPEKSLKRGRGRGGEDDTRAGKRQNVDRRGDRQGRNGRNARAPRQAGNKGPPKRTGLMDDPSERAKAEKRAARFATA
ncbi:SAP domain-containing protein [Hirsutella rhossiliensis]|uniref:SAP domain-containing protein n=1 Tax=Hirsutella rhossiliensis TaxID=111463 RepID=A0A9P8MS19_9HYPO|nr:SAP domain-containing protein [Hirsutella rhossiliensis]KAH0961183.1 SAP domain-containing protein [Hirsutella rhossiliensis]